MCMHILASYTPNTHAHTHTLCTMHDLTYTDRYRCYCIHTVILSLQEVPHPPAAVQWRGRLEDGGAGHGNQTGTERGEREVGGTTGRHPRDAAETKTTLLCSRRELSTIIFLVFSVGYCMYVFVSLGLKCYLRVSDRSENIPYYMDHFCGVQIV